MRLLLALFIGLVCSAAAARVDDKGVAHVARTSEGWVGSSFDTADGWEVLASEAGATWTTAYRVAGQRGQFAVGGGRIVVASEEGLLGGVWPAQGELIPLDTEEPAAGASHVAWNGKQFLVLTDAWAFVSTDGVNWTQNRWREEDDENGGEIVGLAWGAGVWVAAVNGIDGGGNTRHLEVSADGVDWEGTAWVSGEILEAVVFGAGRFLAASNDGAFYTSTDGREWEELEGGPGFSEKLAWDGEYFRVADYDSAARSADGLGWEKTDAGKSRELRAFVTSDDGKSRALLYDAKTGITRLANFEDWKMPAPEKAVGAAPTSSVTHQVADIAALSAERAAREAAQPKVELKKPLVDLFTEYDAAMANARDRDARVKVSLDYLKTLQAAGVPEEKSEVLEVAQRIKWRGPRAGDAARGRIDFDDLFLLLMKAPESTWDGSVIRSTAQRGRRSSRWRRISSCSGTTRSRPMSRRRRRTRRRWRRTFRQSRSIRCGAVRSRGTWWRAGNCS